MTPHRLVPWLFVALGGCSSDSDPAGQGGAGGGDDGRFHPPPNGVAMTEPDACAAIHQALQAGALGLGCTATLRPCPDLLRVEFATNCLLYDEGTVAGCVDFYTQSNDCADFVTPLRCALVTMPGSEPAGCP